MFHRIGNRVVSLHRESIGTVRLPEDLSAGGWRLLEPAEAWAAVASGDSLIFRNSGFRG
jgi:16S rRNA U516 pseudouridylate synthase RsuA-like enzyme